MGESNAYGMNASSPRNEWVQVLGDCIREFQDEPVRVFNNAIPANVISPDAPGYAKDSNPGTAPSALERFEEHMIAYRPDMAVYAYGLNDSRCGHSLESFMRAYRTIVSKTKKALPDVLLVLVGPYWVVQYDVEMWRQLGRETKSGPGHFGRAGDDRQHQLTRVMISGALIFGLLGLLLVGVLYVRRYRTPVVEDRPLDARGLWIAAGVGLAMLGAPWGLVMALAGALQLLIASRAAASLFFLWRASPGLQVLNLLFFLGCLFFVVTLPKAGSLHRAHVAELTHAGVVSGVRAPSATFLSTASLTLSRYSSNTSFGALRVLNVSGSGVW